MSYHYLHRTLIFLLRKVYSVQMFIQHAEMNNVIKLCSRRHFIWAVAAVTLRNTSLKG